MRQASTKYLQKYGRLENLMKYFFHYAMLSINKIQQRNGENGCILHFTKKEDLRITKHYEGITLNVTATLVYNTLLPNRIKQEIKEILKKN